MLSPQFLDELRARTTLSTLVGKDVKIVRAGREWKGCCPFHNEKTPSFYVNDEKGFTHCFGCSHHGDAIRWMTDFRGLSFMPASDPRAAEKAKARDGLININERASLFFAKVLIKGDVPDPRNAMEYLERRGISSSSIEKFKIGFAPGSKIGDPSPLMQALDGVDPKVAESLGLVKRNPDSGRVYDFFRRRIIIPIHDARGGAIGFGGRILGDGEPKYLNSPDTPVFDKGRTLFNLHRASAPARAKGQLLIVEGYMDVIGLDSVGFDTAVAPNGTALTEAQLALAWKLVDTPVVCFDGDKAGRKAAVRAARRALPVMEPGKGLRFATPPEGKDPDDLAREGGLEAVNAMIEAAVPLVEVIWRDLVERHDLKNPDRRAALSAEIRELIAQIRDGDVRRAYQHEFRRLYSAAGLRSGAAVRAPSGGERANSVAIAVEAALVVGLVDHPGVIDGHGIDVTRLRWRHADHLEIATAIYNTGAELYGERITREQALAALEKAGLTEKVSFLRRIALKLPFSSISNEGQAEDTLAAALRENFNPRS